MKTRIVSYLFILSVIALQACGTSRPLSVDIEPKVQTTFFGVTFGEGTDYKVMEQMTMEQMTMNGVGRGWRSLNKESWVIQNVSFAGNEWDGMIVEFTDHKFSRIIFADRFSTEDDALKELHEMRVLLGKKYELRQQTLAGEQNIYAYFDSVGNMVSLVVAEMKDLEATPWVCGISYSWYKAPQLKEEKALNEI